MGSTPRYRAIADDLTDKIKSGHYRAGEALPAQRELSASYGVTMMTLRQALQVLSAEGLIVQRAGRGIVCGAGQRRIPSRLAAQSRRRPAQTGLSAADGGGVGRDPAGAGPLAGLLGGRRPLRLVRVRHLLGRPAVHQISWIAEPHASAIKGDRSSPGPCSTPPSPTAGVRVHRATERMRPALLSAEVAALLRHPAGGPVFVSERATYDDQGALVVVDHATILGEAMEIRAERKATDLSLEWVSAHLTVLGRGVRHHRGAVRRRRRGALQRGTSGSSGRGGPARAPNRSGPACTHPLRRGDHRPDHQAGGQRGGARRPRRPRRRRRVRRATASRAAGHSAASSDGSVVVTAAAP